LRNSGFAFFPTALKILIYRSGGICRSPSSASWRSWGLTT